MAKPDPQTAKKEEKRRTRKWVITIFFSTIAISAAKKNGLTLHNARDLTAEWDKVSTEGSLVQGCVVVRKEFAQANPQAIALFLEEYGASIQTMLEDIEGTAAKIEANGIFTKAAVAAKAIPNCNVCFITGAEMKTALEAFMSTMFEVAPASVGGSIPGEDFYYISE